MRGRGGLDQSGAAASEGVRGAAFGIDRTQGLVASATGATTRRAHGRSGSALLDDCRSAERLAGRGRRWLGAWTLLAGWAGAAGLPAAGRAVDRPGQAVD